MEIRETQEVFFSIKRDIPQFDEKEFLDNVKWSVQNLHYYLRKNEYNKVKTICSEKVIEKLMEQKQKFKISDNIDNVSVQYTKLLDYLEEEQYIKVYVSIYFYDNAGNNADYKEDKHKFWNDIWIVTYKKNGVEEYKSHKCDNCGASMIYSENQNMLKCSYCGNEKYFTKDSQQWTIINIEVQ